VVSVTAVFVCHGNSWLLWQLWVAVVTVSAFPGDVVLMTAVWWSIILDAFVNCDVVIIIVTVHRHLRIANNILLWLVYWMSVS